ncbi:MAG: PASTA domain-containing protein [Desertimonas sp.]
MTRLVATGSSTIVADAEDTELHRPVTLKLVRPEWAELPEFREQFDQTMTVVAKLAHPNIAAVHDWGQDVVGKRTTVFAVTEFLGGGSLRDLFDRGRYLDPSQALLVGLEACRGLDFAHRKGLIHTELTPAKLVFGDDRRLRIVDFGLARLLGRRDWDNPADVATHVARYASPEQAAGERLDGRSDVYSLALVLVEAVTKRVPFAERSTVATLTARVGRLMPVSADLGPLAAVLERAGRPTAAERSTAAELGRGLVRTAEKLPRPTPIPILVAELFDDSGSLRRPNDPTGGLRRPAPEPALALVPPPLVPAVAAPTAGPSAVATPAATDAPAAVSEVEASAAPDVAVPDFAEPDADAAPSASVPAPADTRDGDAVDTEHDVAGDDDIAGHDDIDADIDGTTEIDADATDVDGTTEIVTVAPDVDGATEIAADATADTETGIIDAADVDGTTEIAADATDVDGTTEIDTGDTETDIAATGTGTDDADHAAPVADVSAPGDDAAAGSPGLYDGDTDVTKDELAALARTPAPTDGGVDRPRVAVRGEVGIDEATVAGSPPDGGRDGDRPGRSRWLVAVGGFLVLAALATLAFVAYLLFRVPRHEVPALAGLDLDAAQALIADFEWDVQVTQARSDAEPDVGQVIQTNPAAGQDLAEGEPFEIVVSEGPEFRILPELAGLTRGQAETELAELRLVTQVGEDVFDEDVAAGDVVSWSVPSDSALVAGGEVLPDTVVEIIVSKGPEPRSLPNLVGMTIEEATAALSELRIEINVSEAVFDNDAPAGEIVAANPPAEAVVERESTVTVTPSKGPDLVVIPDVTGQSLAEARTTLTAADLQVGALLGNTAGTVVQASVAGDVVAAGDQHLRYTAIDLALI